MKNPIDSAVQIEADTLNNVLKTVMRIFGVAGTATKNVIRKETVLPLKMVSLEKLKFLAKMLGQESWKQLSFSHYRRTDGLTSYSLELVRSSPDDSGYNSVLLSSETAVGVFCVISSPPNVTSMVHKRQPEVNDVEPDMPEDQEVEEGEMLVSAVKDASAYSWFAYTGTKPLTLKSRGGSTLILNNKDKFGTRPSATGNGKFIRLIGEKTGLTKVFTLAFDDVAKLIQACKPVRIKLASVTEAAAPKEKNTKRSRSYSSSEAH